MSLTASVDSTSSCDWIIILGYGRSGSTWLELSIAEKIHAVALGEVQMLKRSDAFCSCGLKIKSCTHWQDHLSLSNEELLKKLSKNKIITDSSKSTHGAIKYLNTLRKNKTLNVIPIICFRNPTLVQRSTTKGSNRDIRQNINRKKNLHWLKLLLTWPTSYIIAFLFCGAIKVRPLVVNFDKLDSINKLIFKLVREVQVTENLDIAPKHMIEGNRLNSSPRQAYIQPSRIENRSLPEKIVYTILFPLYSLLKYWARKQSD